MRFALIILAALACPAQSPAFEVAAVKPASPGGQVRVRRDPGRLDITDMTLRALMRYAYDVKDVQISGGPAWMDSDRWDVAAKAGGEITDDQRKQMLQGLLMERFQMTIRHEQKEMAVYALGLAKNGSKLMPAKEGKPQRISLQFGATGLMQMQGENVPLSQIAAVLASPSGRIVVDRTGITGTFDYKLEWVPDATNMPAINGSKVVPTADGPSIFTAVQEQLGLKLESVKARVDILVIDHAEKPVVN